MPYKGTGVRKAWGDSYQLMKSPQKGENMFDSSSTHIMGEVWASSDHSLTYWKREEAPRELHGSLWYTNSSRQNWSLNWTVFRFFTNQPQGIWRFKPSNWSFLNIKDCAASFICFLFIGHSSDSWIHTSQTASRTAEKPAASDASLPLLNYLSELFAGWTYCRLWPNCNDF